MHFFSHDARPVSVGEAISIEAQEQVSDATAQAAKAAGLLTPQALGRLLSNALRKREAAQSLRSVADGVAAADIAPMTMDEIDAEVKAVRAVRRARADRH